MGLMVESRGGFFFWWVGGIRVLRYYGRREVVGGIKGLVDI